MVISPKQFIVVEGVRVDLLITPSMFTFVREKGWKIEVDQNDISTITLAYLRLIYAAALNNVMAKQIDDPDYPKLQITYEQLEMWSIENTEELGQLIVKIAKLLTRNTKEIAREEKKKKRLLSRWIMKR